MDKDIVVENDRLVRLMEWFEKKSHPMKSLILTVAGFVIFGLIIGMFILINLIFGPFGAFLLGLFMFSYLFILFNL